MVDLLLLVLSGVTKLSEILQPRITKKRLIPHGDKIIVTKKTKLTSMIGVNSFKNNSINTNKLNKSSKIVKTSRGNSVFLSDGMLFDTHDDFNNLSYSTQMDVENELFQSSDDEEQVVLYTPRVKNRGEKRRISSSDDDESIVKSVIHIFNQNECGEGVGQKDEQVDDDLEENDDESAQSGDDEEEEGCDGEEEEGEGASQKDEQVDDDLEENDDESAQSGDDEEEEGCDGEEEEEEEEE